MLIYSTGQREYEQLITFIVVLILLNHIYTNKNSIFFMMEYTLEPSWLKSEAPILTLILSIHSYYYLFPELTLPSSLCICTGLSTGHGQPGQSV